MDDRPMETPSPSGARSRVPSGHLGDALSALLDGELGGAGAAEVARAHLAGCPACAAENLAVSQARTWLRALPPVEPPADFYPRLFATDVVDPGPAGPGPAHGATVVPLDRAPRSRWRAGVAAMVACAAATVVVLGLVAPHDASTAPPVTRFIEAHATAGGGGDPVSDLAPAVVPVAFRP
ncbi:MAG: anti-sigma factor family protein [Acidimicrobiales bacterium]